MFNCRDFAVYALYFSLAFGVFVGCGAKREFDALPELRKAPEFSGINYDGQHFHSSELAGRIWIADFIFTTCAEICPKMSDNTARLIRLTGGKIPVVSITVDPEYDSLPILREYAAKYAGGNKLWHFISMPLDSVRKTSVKGFAVGNYENPMEHSSRLIVVDEKGMIRGYYDGVDSSAVNALALLLKDAVK